MSLDTAFDGAFAENIRQNTQLSKAASAELRKSLETMGWRPEFPALVDEHDFILVGHRRLIIAKELKIEPVIKKVTLGDGVEANGERLKIALASNIGGAPLTKKDRQHITQHLYGTLKWDIRRIAEALDVSKSTVAVDLANVDCPDAGQSKRPKTTSNPKGSGRRKGAKDGCGKKNPVKKGHGHGVSVKVPNGFASLSEAANAGIKIEMATGMVTGAMEASGLARHTYRAARDIVLLARRDDLSAKDSAIAKQALHELDERRQALQTLESVKAISTKVWGNRGLRFRADKRRLNQFMESLCLLVGTCSATSALSIPLLGPDQKIEAIDMIREAQNSLAIFSRRLKKENLP